MAQRLDLAPANVLQKIKRSHFALAIPLKACGDQFHPQYADSARARKRQIAKRQPSLPIRPSVTPRTCARVAHATVQAQNHAGRDG